MEEREMTWETLFNISGMLEDKASTNLSGVDSATVLSSQGWRWVWSLSKVRWLYDMT